MDERCREFRRVFLLSEGLPGEDPHPRTCADCRAFAEAERKTAEVLRVHAPRWQPPAHLREGITATLERERSDRARGLYKRRALVAAGAVLALIGGTAMWRVLSHSDGQQRAHATTVLIADDFLKFASLGPEKLQVTSGNGAEVERFFAEHLRLAAKVPRLSGLALIGGRRCNLGGRPAALLFFEQGAPESSEPYALFVFEPRGEDWSAMPEVPELRGRRACHQSKRGVGILIWEERGLVYALAGAQDIEHLKEHVAAF
ncbi:MAG: hypothetical protein HY725_09625 [Candidatus Rokubacteria bacterium]|nr:hypothetical protein [Candidatus Rokubacteria bacterium]